MGVGCGLAGEPTGARLADLSILNRPKPNRVALQRAMFKWRQTTRLVLLANGA